MTEINFLVDGKLSAEPVSCGDLGRMDGSDWKQEVEVEDVEA